MMLPVEVSPRARREIRQALEWWFENRAKAPRAFSEDLRKAFRLIRAHPGVGVSVLGGSRERFRVNLQRVRYALYYEVLDTRIRVLAVWQANRGETPKL